MNKNTEIDLKKNYEDILVLISPIKSTSLISKCTKMDFELLNMSNNDVFKFQKENGIIPGYNTLLCTFAYLCSFNVFGKECNLNDLVSFSTKIDNCTIFNLQNKGAIAVNEYYRLQHDWQRKYIFKTYLLYLLISQNDLLSLYNKHFTFTPIEMSGICLYNKILSEPSVAVSLVQMKIMPSAVINNYIEFLYKYFPFIAISLEDFKKKQESNFINSNYDLFAARLLVRDYPIITINKHLFVSSYFYIQDSLFSRIIYKLSDKGTNSKIIGDAFEMVVYKCFSAYYTNVAPDELHDDCIQLNPRIKKTELCDVLVKKNNKYLLLDCKAKEFNEEIYISNSNEQYQLAEKVLQRYKRIVDIKENKFSKYFPKNIDIENIYSLVVVVDYCVYSKETCFDSMKNALSADQIEYCKKHVDIITYDELIEYCVANVDLISVMERNKINGDYKNSLCLSIKKKDKKKYHKEYDEWYKKSINELLKILSKYKILPINSK